MDWTDPTISESIEEREVEMFGLLTGFATRMCKRAINAQEETTPASKFLAANILSHLDFDEEV